MDGTYRMKLRVTSHDVGPERTLKPSSMLGMMQETAGRHLAQDGLTYEVMRAQGIVFLLVTQAVRITKLPHCDDEIEIVTSFERTRGARFVRGMRFFDKDGLSLIEASTLWIIADPATHRILRPGALPFELPKAGENPVGVEAKRIELPAGAGAAGVRTVRWSDIDCNRHMNNAVYADLVCDYYPGGFEGKSLGYLQIDFTGEAALGDDIEIKTTAAPDGTAVFEGTIKGKSCFRACGGAWDRQD